MAGRALAKIKQVEFPPVPSLALPQFVSHGNRWFDHKLPVLGRFAYQSFHYLLNERDSKSRYDVSSK